MKKTPANKQKKVKKRLGMGLSSLLSKDNELASLIKAKVESKVKTKISNSGDKNLEDNKPKFNILSNRENTKISNLRLVENTQSMMPIQNLVSGKFQPRKIFDQNELEELAESIKSNGILQPILVRSLNTGNSYEIVAGERRWRAAQLAKLHEVPVIVRDFDDQTALGVAMIENLQRTDLNIVEEAEGYRKLMNTFQYTQEKLSQHIGKSRSHIANILRMLSLPSYVRRHIVNGDLSFGHAKSLASLNDEDAKTVTNKIIDEDLNVRQTEKLVNTFRKSLENRGFRGTNKEPITNPNIDYLERELTNLLGLKVVFLIKLTILVQCPYNTKVSIRFNQ